MKKGFIETIRIIVSVFLILVMSLVFIGNSYAINMILNNNEENEWQVKIMSDGQELEKTHNIVFTVEENEDVVKGKIAPGLNASARIEIDLTGTKVPVDIWAEIDDKSLNKAFKLTTKLDDQDYLSGTVMTVEIENDMAFTEENGKKVLILELEWIDNINSNDNLLAINGESINIPVKVTVKQHL